MDQDGRVDTPRFGKIVYSNLNVSKRGSSATSMTSRSSDAGDLDLDLFRLNGDSRLHPLRARDLSDVGNKNTISKDNTSGAELRKADLFEYIGRKLRKIPREGEWSGAVGSSSSPEWEQDLSQNGPQNAQQLMQARFIQQQQAMMREKMQNGQLPGMQMGQQRMTDANIGMPNGAPHITREGGQQAQLEQRMAMQTQQQVSMLSTKLFQENLATWLQQQQLTQETCPPDLLQKFKMQCLGSARQKIMQLRQHQQHQQLQASLMQQKQHMGGQMSPRRIPSM